jgi:hypothetical protein
MRAFEILEDGKLFLHFNNWHSCQRVKLSQKLYVNAHRKVRARPYFSSIFKSWSGDLKDPDPSGNTCEIAEENISWCYIPDGSPSIFPETSY